MDIAKYIGLFLLKNNFVYVHGLGQLEIKKRPATYSEDALQPPAYDVFLSQVGSIDDNLANFVATNEQVSISKASNSLREFSMAARSDIQAGKTVEIPGIGKFAEEKAKVIFITDPNFRYAPAAIPAVKIARRQDETIYTATSTKIPSIKPQYEEEEDDDSDSKSGISWVKIMLWLAILAIICALAYFGYQYMRNHNGTEEPPLIETPKQDTLPQMSPPVMVDSTLLPQTDTTTQVDTIATTPPVVATPSGPTVSFAVVLNNYTDEAKAKRRVDKLKSYGNPVRLEVGKDSSYLVVLAVSKAIVADTSKLMDSLARTFNPTEGVRVLR